MLRRFPSAPALANSSSESSTYKARSDLRQSILHRHRHITPMSDKRRLMRSTNLAEKQKHASMYRMNIEEIKEEKKKKRSYFRKLIFRSVSFFFFFE